MPTLIHFILLVRKLLDHGGFSLYYSCDGFSFFQWIKKFWITPSYMHILVNNLQYFNPKMSIKFAIIKQGKCWPSLNFGIACGSFSRLSSLVYVALKRLQ